MCDGVRHCPDNSDETALQCEYFVCDPGFTKCPDGACAKNESDCKALRAEDHSHRVANRFCRIPQVPTNGFVQYLYSPGIHLIVNQVVPNLAKVQFTCIKNHRIVGNDTIACREGIWDSEAPQCQPFCAGIAPTVTFSAKCKLENAIVNCTEPAKQGTLATMHCKYGYESIVSGQQQTTCGADGLWYPLPFECSQICGGLTERTAMTISRLPWQVSIYKRNDDDLQWEYICGGTVVSAKVVVSAAHCFWNEQNDEFYDESLFSLKTGKLFREYDDSRELNAVQIVSKLNIQFPIGFEKIGDAYVDDIVIVIFNGNEFIEFSFNTLPICIDYGLEEEEKYVTPGLKGLVGVWGADQTIGESNSTLNIVELTVITREKCKENTSKENIQFITDDQYCAEGLSPGVASCQISSGNGLVFPIKTNKKIKYFFRGVAGNVPCNNHIQFSLFSNVAASQTGIHYYDNMIKPVEHSLNNDSSIIVYISQECLLTDIPKNGYVSYLAKAKPTLFARLNHLKMHQGIENNVAIRYFCIGNYSLKGKMTNACLNGVWSNTAPECVMKVASKTSECFIFTIIIFIEESQINCP